MPSATARSSATISGALRRGREAWSRFWFPTGPPHALALFRIGFGLVVLLRWLSLAPHVTLLLSNQGIYLPRIELPGGGPPPALAWALYLAAVASTGAVVLGLVTRLALLLQAVLLGYHWIVYFYATNFSYDALFLILTLCLVPSPCGRALSLDARGSGTDATASWPLWTQRLICAQIALLYFGSAVFKISSPAWNNGEVLFQTLQDMWATGLGLRLIRLGLPRGVFDLACYATIVFELSLPVMLSSRRWWGVAAGLGTLFHTTIAALLSIWQFLVVPPAYVLFADPEDVRRRVEAWTARFGR
ncbi:MAG TPA: HTTM domain-containing protein [Candidatus Polarisedimenticolaceae bacterium]|nr:HTTM domain-containing protein [Candidatus Polarisedimenticolaceae bacterium]